MIQNTGSLFMNEISDLSNDDLVKRLSQQLNEKKPDILLRAINFIGRNLFIKLVIETFEICSEGGLMKISASEKKSPGGVLMSLIKSKSGFSKHELKVKVFQPDYKQRNEKRKMYKMMNEMLIQDNEGANA